MSRIIYFEKIGPQNTDETLRLAKDRADELGIRDIIVSSTRGWTGVRAIKYFKGHNIVIVNGSAVGTPWSNTLKEENRKIIEENGGKILTCTMIFSNFNAAISNKYHTYGWGLLISDVLRSFGEGTKVAIEIMMAAVDAGLVQPSKEVISIGGSGIGVDTALVLKSTGSINFFDFEVREIICKPRNNIRKFRSCECMHAHKQE